MCGKGSSGGGYGSLAPIQQTTVQASPQAIGAYSKALEMASAATSQPFQKYSTDPNAFVAPLTQTQQQAIGGIQGAQGAYQPYYGAAGAMTAGAGATTTPQVVGQYMNPFMQQVVQPVQSALQQQQGQQLAQQQAESIRAGAFGGQRDALTRATLRGQQQLGMGQALSPLYAQGYGQALQGAQADLSRQLQAGQALGALGTGAQTAALQAPQALLGAGTLEQQTQQAGLTALYNQFLQERAYPYQQAQFYAGIAGGLGPLLGQTTYGAQAQNPFGMFLSEPDEKEGARPAHALDGEVLPPVRNQPDLVGKTFDNQNIYAASYRGQNAPQLMLMADEVENQHPEAIARDGMGTRYVDYASATDDAARLGGAVKDVGDYARGGLAIGGHLSYVDPTDPSSYDRRKMDALLASHKAGLEGASTEYGPSGSSYISQKTYVPSGKISAGQQLQASPFAQIAAKKAMGLGDILATGEKIGSALDKGSQAYKGIKGAWESGRLARTPIGEETGQAEWAQPYQTAKGGSVYASGGIVPTTYIPEELTGNIQTSHALRGDPLPEKQQDQKKGPLDVAETALDYGVKYGPVIAAGLAKAAPFLATLSEPSAKEGVRRGYRDGSDVSPADDIFERGLLGAESAHRQFDREGRTLTSPKGALGIAQIMPTTAPEAAKLAGLEYDPVRLRQDAEYNKALGKAYYEEQLRNFGTPELAAAAYNAGPGAVRNALRRAEATGRDVMSFLPAETRAYVPKVMGRDIGHADVASAARELAAGRREIPVGDPRRSFMAKDLRDSQGVGAARPAEEALSLIHI